MSVCRRCGAQFGCAMVAQDRGYPRPDRMDAAPEGGEPRPVDDEACWCTLLPAVVPVPNTLPNAAGACWCRACLQRHLDERQSALTGAVSL